MYRCERCGECPPPRTPCKSIVVQKVNFLHPERSHAKKGIAILKNGKKKAVWIPDPGGWGYQTVREMKMCPRCAWAWQKEQEKYKVSVAL